jgi:hypothetical protein
MAHCQFKAGQFSRISFCGILSCSRTLGTIRPSEIRKQICSSYKCGNSSEVFALTRYFPNALYPLTDLGDNLVPLQNWRCIANCTTDIAKVQLRRQNAEATCWGDPTLLGALCTLYADYRTTRKDWRENLKRCYSRPTDPPKTAFLSKSLPYILPFAIVSRPTPHAIRSMGLAGTAFLLTVLA